jgi:hypothetical protein
MRNLLARKRNLSAILILFLATACATAYVAKPLPFRMPESYQNAQEFGGATIAARAYADKKEARNDFGFDVIGAGMLPVEIVIDNKGVHPLEINGAQTFLEDEKGNLWPVLNQEQAYQRATRYADTKETFSGAAQSGFLGAAAGAAIGLAIGVLSGHNIGSAVGKGAVVGAVGGGLVGGANANAAGDARHAIVEDLRSKSLQARSVAPGTLAYGFMFFPAEAQTARTVRVQIIEKDTGKTHILTFAL